MTTTTASSSYLRSTKTPAAYALSSLGRLTMTPRTPLSPRLSAADKMPFRARERQDSTASAASSASSSMSSSTISSGYSSCTEYDADVPSKEWSSTAQF
ncbi:uncharacterized protein H6S33_005954 [Morchella sextelata]|uniref:uncharacterized protein n=1 Tax=Morchella sextelata TaxID=1174677 RepID=UPI001D057DA5|nr:uncharacterized protein H6S33_005954 [Morchella sextelata]KAH0614068.1 hypothetical protein H6S33_005954 [Morchella sextelata]